MRRSSRKTRNVKNVNESENEESDADEKEQETPRRGLRKRNPSASKNAQVEILDLEDEDDSETNLTKSISFETSDDTMAGFDIFTFQNPKPKSAMKDKAANSVKLQSPKTLVRESHKKTQIKSNNNAKKTATKNGELKSPEPNKIDNSTTPYSTRRRTSKRLQKILLNEESSSEDDEIESESDDEPTNTKQKKASSKAAENYFRAHEDKSKNRTSNKTLPKLEIQDIETETLTQIVSSPGPHHKKFLADLNSQHKSKFPKWMFQLREGFNLLFYGFGSKYSLLQEFNAKMLPGYDTVIINGFAPNITIKEILCTVTDLLEVQCKLQNPAEQLNGIQKKLLRSDSELFLIVHNIDGSLLRNDKTQSALCKLAQLKGVHVLASIDHINAPLIWDQARCGKFNWLWHDVTTYEPYVRETCNKESMLLFQQSSSLALSSLIHVFRSLTPNAKGIFLILANYQLSQKDEQGYNGIPFHDFYSQCREAFLVNSDATMKAQLTEFKDHKLVRHKKDPDGTECMLIPLEHSILEEFVEQHSENC